MKFSSLLTIALSLLFTSCEAQNQSSTGKIIYGYSGSINSYNFATKTDKVLFQEGAQPSVASNGDIYFLNLKFPKVKELIRKYTPAMQFKDVLDLSAENPIYKADLENYSVIKGTGISGIFNRMSDPRISPNGKYISVTIYGGSQKAFTKNCVAIFDLATKQLVKKFDDKYYASWLPDGRILMSGTHKNSSVNESTYPAVTPGIFLCEANFSSIKRIDPQLDDPSPYHATVSLDAKKIAYVLNGHVWIMDIDGKNNRQLTDVDRDNEETYPVFSPDGKTVACWSYKTFERSFFTAIAVVPANLQQPIALTDKAAIWPKDQKNKRITGGSGPLNWVK